MIETYLIFLLSSLVVFQHIFWTHQTHKLMDKLMCRNYFEYQQASQAFTPKPVTAREPDPEEDLDALAGMGGF